MMMHESNSLSSSISCFKANAKSLNCRMWTFVFVETKTAHLTLLWLKLHFEKDMNTTSPVTCSLISRHVGSWRYIKISLKI